MKTGITKSARHEWVYVILLTLPLIALAAIVFPLFIALFPLFILIGCVSIWRQYHTRNDKP